MNENESNVVDIVTSEICKKNEMRKKIIKTFGDGPAQFWDQSSGVFIYKRYTPVTVY